MIFGLHLLQLLVLSQLPKVACTGTVSEVEITALYDLWTSTQGFQWFWRDSVIEHKGVYITGGQPWNFSTPLSSSQPCLDGDARWQGVNCSANNDHISDLFLPLFGMNGTLPSTLCDLSALSMLTLSANMLHGAIPSCISKLTALSVLNLQNNLLSGPIPDSLWDMTQLEWLQLFRNRLSGPLSPGVGNLLQMKMLSLASNLLSGELPAEINKLHSVVYVPIGMSLILMCSLLLILLLSVLCFFGL